MLYLQAFWDLSTCRSIGMSLGPIPWDAIVRYMEYHQIPDELHETFLAAMTVMDATYLQWTDNESKKRGDVQHTGKGRHTRRKA